MAQASTRGVAASSQAAAAPGEVARNEAEQSEEDQEARFWARIQQHQKSAAKLSNVEEARTVVDSCRRAVLSTISKKYEGYPAGSMVGFASDDRGRPVLLISSLSPHTSDLDLNSKCSLLISRDASEQSEAVVTLIGDGRVVPESETAAVRGAYMKKHPNAFWVDFGDFRFVRIEPHRVRLVANVATFAVGASVADISAEEYGAAQADPVAPFEAPIAGHMNADHGDSTVAMVEHALDVKVPSAKILNVDRFGLRVEVPLKGQLSRIRLPFPRPAESRKDVKDLIVEMTKAAKQGLQSEKGQGASNTDAVVA